MGSAFETNRQDTPRTEGEDVLANLFKKFFTPGASPNLDFGGLSIPQFGGELTAAPNQLQTGGFGVAQQGQNAFGDTGLQNIMQILGGVTGQTGGMDFLPPELRAAFGLPAFGGGGGGVNLAAGAPGEVNVPEFTTSQFTLPGQTATRVGGGGGSGGGGDGLGGEGDGTRFLPEFAVAPPPGGLGGQPPPIGNEVAGSGVGSIGAAENILSGIGTSGSPDFAALGQALRGQSDIGLDRTIRDLREQFSTAGLRFGSDIRNEVARAGNESTANLNAELARLGISAAESQGQLRLGAGQALGGLGLGQTGQISDLFSGGAGRQQEANLALPGIFSGLSNLPTQVGGGGFALGEGFRGIQDTENVRRAQEFQRTEATLLPMLLNFFAGAPQITSPGIGQQLLGFGGAAAGGK